MTDISIQKGSILSYRVFDIAEEIDLRQIEGILRQDQGNSRAKLARSTRRALIIRDAPVRLNLGTLALQIGDEVLQSETVATVWDYGAVSILFQVPIEAGTQWSELVRKSRILNGDMKGSEGIDELARQKVRELMQLFAPALKKPDLWETFEDYTIYFFEQVNGIRSGSELLQKTSVPSLILGEPDEILAEKCKSGIVESHYQYAENDLVVIDWNSAIVLEPSGQRDIPDVLEFALSHLLELRFYDDLLDSRLSDLYDRIGVSRHSLFRSAHGKAAKEANTRFVEFLELTEKLENSLKIVGDFYLAVLFRGAMRRFRAMDWQTSVGRKMNALARISELLQGETNVYRGHLLEMIIIFLIAFEIVSALLKIM